MSAASIFWSAFLDGLSFGGNGEMPGAPTKLFADEPEVDLALPEAIVSLVGDRAMLLIREGQHYVVGSYEEAERRGLVQPTRIEEQPIDKRA